MSIEVNSYEELHICNANEKTAAICGLVGEYLVANWLQIVFADRTRGGGI